MVLSAMRQTLRANSDAVVVQPSEQLSASELFARFPQCSGEGLGEPPASLLAWWEPEKF